MKTPKLIKHHPIRSKWMLESDYEANQKFVVKCSVDVRVKPFLLTTLSRYALGRGVYDWAINGDNQRFIEALKTVHLARTSHWKGMVSDGAHTIILPGIEPIQSGQIGTNAAVDFNTWLQGIYIAMILRDIGAVKVYGEADPEKIVRYGQNTPDPWEIPYIHFLNGIWAFDPNIGSYLKQALIGADPSGHNPGRADWMLHILSPLLELWATVFTQNPDRFNAKLYDQQTLRHDWHAALGEESGNSIMEYIDLAALAATCYAHNKGFPIEVQSDYLPEFLIKGDFPKLQWPDPEWKG